MPDEPTHHRPVDRSFDLESAARSGAEGRLAAWVHDFLSSPGSDNEILAVALAQRDLWWLGPVRFELAQLTPMAGPDEDEVVVSIAPDEWEHDLGDMAAALEHGWVPPPLLVSSRDGGYFLEDGNHRHASLVRAGETHGWAIVWFETEEDRAAFATGLDDEDLPTSSRELAELSARQLDDVVAPDR